MQYNLESRSNLPRKGLQIFCKYLYNVERQWRRGEQTHNIHEEVNVCVKLTTLSESGFSNRGHCLLAYLLLRLRRYALAKFTDRVVDSCLQSLWKVIGKFFSKVNISIIAFLVVITFNCVNTPTTQFGNHRARNDAHQLDLQ